MLTCKQVSNALSKEDYEKLPPLQKLFLKLHVKLCFVCGKFNKQVMESQDMCRCYKENENAVETTRPKLDPDQKNALKQLLAEQSKANSKK